MEKRRRILLLGDSVMLGAINASLRCYPQYQVTILSSTPDALELEALIPDVMIFDLEGPRPEEAFAMLESRPDVQLIGISPDSNVVRIWSGKRLQELSTQDLMNLIDGQ